MHDRRSSLQRFLWIDDRGQRLEVRFNKRRRIFGGIAALRDDDREGLANVPDLVAGEQRLLRVQDVMLDGVAPLLGQRHLMIGHRRQKLGQLESRSARKPRPVRRRRA